MSDSEDEFGGLAPTTPLPAAAKRKARSEKPSSRTQDAAGPSHRKLQSTANSGGNGAKKKARMASRITKKGEKADTEVEMMENEEHLETHPDDIQDDTAGEDQVEEMEIALPPQKQRGGSKKPVSKDSAPARMAASSKAKGKQRAPTNTNIRSGRNGAEIVDLVDEEDDDDGMDVEVEAMEVAGGGRPAFKAGTRKGTGPNATSNPRRPNAPPLKAVNRSETDVKLAAENKRLKEEAQRLKGHIEDLKAKFEELMHTRHVEPEALMEEMVHRHETEISVQNELIKDLHAQLAKKEPLLRAAASSGKKATFSLISRDEADEDMREQKAQVQNLKNELTGAKKIIAGKDEEITTLTQQVSELRFELKTEIQRSEQLSKQSRNPPGSATRGNPILKGDDPKHAKVISLYEDLTNILVPTVKCTPGQHEGDEWTFSCIYTWKDDIDSKLPERNLNFALRTCKEPPTEAPGQLIDSVHYHPLMLEMESQEFIDNLGFLSKPFSFPQTQLSLFVRTLYDNLNVRQDDDDD